MDNVLLSELERFYLIQGAELGCRIDGRAADEYRPVELETNILSHANGSASVRMGDTFIVCCVKMEVGKPLLSGPDKGRVEINVECYPTATFNRNEKSAHQVAECLQSTLQSAYGSQFLNLHSLCIQPGRQCWIVYIDLLLLEGAGNLLDAASLAIKAALINAKYSDPLVQYNFQEKSLNDNIFSTNIDGHSLPIFVTVHKIGSAHVVDASKEEEACSLFRLSTVIYPNGSFGSLLQEGCGSSQLETVIKMSELAVASGKELHNALSKTLKLEQQLRS